MLQEFLALNVFAFLLVFARIGTAVFLLPGFSAPYVPPRVRLPLALALSLVIVPVVAAGLPARPASVPALVLLILGEMLVGLFLGFLVRLLLSALQVAGTVISLVSAMANAFVQDPIVEQQSATISGFLSTLGLVLVFANDLHHPMLQALVDSYGLFVPGQPVAIDDMSEAIARRVAESFALGLRLATPVVVVGFVYYLGLGLLTRLMPQLPVFFVGLPVQIVVQFVVILLALSGMMLVFLRAFADGFARPFVP